MKKAALLACRRAIEFTIEVGFKELVIKGDNYIVMKAIKGRVPIFVAFVISICYLLNLVGSLLRMLNVKQTMLLVMLIIFWRMTWIENPPPLTLEALYFDLVHIQHWMKFEFIFKQIKNKITWYMWYIYIYIFIFKIIIIREKLTNILKEFVYKIF